MRDELGVEIGEGISWGSYANSHYEIEGDRSRQPEIRGHQQVEQPDRQPDARDPGQQLSLDAENVLDRALRGTGGSTSP